MVRSGNKIPKAQKKYSARRRISLYPPLSGWRGMVLRWFPVVFLTQSSDTLVEWKLVHA